eukprot:COSAG05_NODE_706_length_7849_cov_13.773290_5_plen_43_part_00
MSAVLRGLESPDWADGASINIVDTAGRALGNVETYVPHLPCC